MVNFFVRFSGPRHNTIFSIVYFGSQIFLELSSFFRRNIQRRNPFQLLAVPELFSRLFSVAIHILSEKGYLFCSACDAFLYFSQNLFLWSGFFTPSRIGNDAIATEIIASRLYDDIRRTLIFLKLFRLQIVIPFCVIPDFRLGDERENLCEIVNLLDSEGEINRVGYSKYLVIAIIERILVLDELDIFYRFPFSLAFIVSPMKSCFPNHASGYTDNEGLPLFFSKSSCLADISIHSIFSLLPYGASIEYEYIGFRALQYFSES